jgi:hypothetical protein
MAKGHGKGGQFERDVCREISLWWSDGTNDDWFWRSSQSGGRATQRAKNGQTTINAAGDIAAQCGEAQVLLDYTTWELKRGYPRVSVADLYEKTSGGFWDFIDQAKKSASLAGTPYWAVIHKRDRRDAVIVMPAAALGLVSDFGEESPEDALIAHNYHLFLTDPSLKTLLKSAIENGRR